MNIIKKSLFNTFLICLVSIGLDAQTLKIATFNVRYANKADVGNLWQDRVPAVSALIRFHDFDVFGTQEALFSQLEDISGQLPEFQRYGVGREDGKSAGEHSAIFFKKDRFELVDKGDFWLSETPGKPSLGWDATCCNRICSWVYLRDRWSKKKFYFFNAHFDHQGIKARNESSKLILEKIKSIAGKEPVILTGDLNADHDSECYLTLENSDLLKDTYLQVKYPYAPNASFNGFGTKLKGKEIIDHIFVTDHFSAKRWGMLTDTYHGKFPSDHFPILCEVELL